MEFGEYLENLIRKRNLSINALSNECNINRGGLYSVFKHQRKLKADQLFDLISRLALTQTEENKLQELYFKDLYGDEEYEKINFLIGQMQNCIPKDECESKKSGTENSPVAKLMEFVKDNSRVITNFPFDFNEADQLFYNAVKNGEIKEFKHIFALDDEGDYKYNYSTVFKTVKYMNHRQFPFYYYTSLKPLKVSSLMPYFAVGDKSAFLFSRDEAVEIGNAESVKILTDKAKSLLENCTQLGALTNDVMQIKDSYQEGILNGEITIAITDYPCLAPFVDYETMKSAVRPELPNKDMLVEIAYSHYSNIYERVEQLNVVSEQGIKRFAETGNFCEISGEFINCVDTGHRVKVLKKVARAIENDKFYILDKSKITIPKGFMIEKYANKVMFYFSDTEKENFALYENFYAEFKDFSFVNDFRLMAEYIIQSHMVYTKEYALQFVNNIIAGLSA